MIYYFYKRTKIGRYTNQNTIVESIIRYYNDILTDSMCSVIMDIKKVI